MYTTEMVQDALRYAEYQRIYREEHKERNAELKRAKKLCDCGSSVSSRNFSSHKRTQKHQRYLEELQNEMQRERDVDDFYVRKAQELMDEYIERFSLIEPPVAAKKRSKRELIEYINERCSEILEA
jgi:CDGSH-type Zn-finger protein